MSKNQKRSLDDLGDDEVDHFDKFREEFLELKKSKSTEEYLELVDEMVVFLQKESNTFKNEVLVQGMKEDAMNEFGECPGLVVLIEKLVITKNEYERVDYHVCSEKTFNLSDFSINISFNGDNEGTGSYYAVLSNKVDEIKLLNGSDDIRMNSTQKGRLKSFYESYLNSPDLKFELFEKFVSWILRDFLERY